MRKGPLDDEDHQGVLTGGWLAPAVTVEGWQGGFFLLRSDLMSWRA